MTAPASTAPLDFFWFIPTHGDGSYLGSEEQQRPPEFGYFKEIAQAVDRLGFPGVLLPTGQNCEDSWITATGLATLTEKLKFLVALRPGVTLPTFAARQTAALDRLSNGRLLLNVVVGGNPTELAGDGVFLPHDERYAQAHEFLTIWRGLVSGERVNFDGKYYRVENGRLDLLPHQERPPLYFGGSSDAGQDLAADLVDMYLTWGEPPAQVAEKLAAARAKAALRGRKLRFGIRLHFIVRETEDEARAVLAEIIAKANPEAVNAFGHEVKNAGKASPEGEGNWAKSSFDDLVQYNDGFRSNLIGTPRQVAQRVVDLKRAGADLILLGFLHFQEEVEYFGKHVIPLVRELEDAEAAASLAAE
ncbi:LLM class flavin-dependent oxidoreductase [Mesorhizobium sp. M7A.T.Ca.TU.009.02.1.1]|uniref:LLM class flavin-dependent oxidoreductase n=1 Tax=Mesorhizobium sp. M7A.T.Ca.TU.009.02.1.1 TaxID=2496791 RepID=UPI0013E3EF53|nr:LLM class flavin-dependent oxidoreductase [Mesorhizobium sp. M7A.T.Ca.TU.009.02.1.1]